MTVTRNTHGSPGEPDEPIVTPTAEENARPMIGRRDWLRVGLAMFAIGYGANLFAPMLEVYRDLNGTGQSSVTAMFGIYAAGLVPALLIFGPISDRRGRRTVLRPAMLVSALGTVILASASVGPEWLLFPGRFVVGASVGMAMACGAAWIKQLSVDQPAAGPRRATIAVSAGFGGGPFIAGLVAEFLPGPKLVPYLVFLGVLAVVIPIMWTTPETQFRSSDSAGAAAARRGPLIPKVALTGTFLWAVAAWAPWVFGTVTVSFVTLPVYVAQDIGMKTAYIGALAGVAMIAGMLIQPTAARVAAKGMLPLSVLALGIACTGMILGALTVLLDSPMMVFPAAIVLGASYGIMMVAGLREVEAIARPDELGALIGVFYALSYIGFFVPFTLSLVAPLVGRLTGLGGEWGIILCLLFGAVVCVASMLPVGRAAEKGLALARRKGRE